MSKVFITGGAGFIGSHLVERMVNEGHEVVVADILLRGNKIPRDIFKQVDFHHANVKDREKMIEASMKGSGFYVPIMNLEDAQNNLKQAIRILTFKY